MSVRKSLEILSQQILAGIILVWRTVVISLCRMGRDPQGWPLLLMFHGQHGNASGFPEVEARADRDGHVVLGRGCQTPRPRYEFKFR